MFDLNPGPLELVIIGALAVMLFGERLPEAARKWGKHLVSLKRSVQGIKDELTGAVSGATSGSSASTKTYQDADIEEEATAPRMVPPPPGAALAAMHESRYSRGGALEQKSQAV